MESQTEYINRLHNRMGAYCCIKRRQRELRKKQELSDNIIFTIEAILFFICIGSLDSLADLILKLL